MCVCAERYSHVSRPRSAKKKKDVTKNSFFEALFFYVLFDHARLRSIGFRKRNEKKKKEKKERKKEKTRGGIIQTGRLKRSTLLL